MILFVDQSGQIGGAELCLADIARYYRKEAKILLLTAGPLVELLRDKGIDTEVLAMPKRLAGVTKKTSLWTSLESMPALAAYLLGLRKKVRDCELLYLNTPKALLYGTAANLWDRKPCILHLHDLWDKEHFRRSNIRLLAAAANRAKAVIANSRASADAFLAAGGRVPVYVVPNGFDPAEFDTISEESVLETRQKLNPENRMVAAIFGRISRWKGQHILIDAAVQRPDLNVWIVGDALFTSDDQAYAEELRQRVLDARLGNRVRFLGFRKDVAVLMKAADVIVHCSTASEPFGRVLVEAMFCRRPTVASRSGGPMEIVEHQATGLLVPPGDVNKLAQALALLEESPAIRESMGNMGRKRAENLFSLGSTTALIDEVICAVRSAGRF